MNNKFDESLVDGILYMKNELGVSFIKMAELLECSDTVFSNLIKGNSTTISMGKKKKLKRIIDQYKQVDLTKIKGDK